MLWMWGWWRDLVFSGSNSCSYTISDSSTHSRASNTIPNSKPHSKSNTKSYPIPNTRPMLQRHPIPDWV